MSRALEIAGGIAMLAVVMTKYIMPTLIALRRRHPQLLPISILNGLGGWTGLGWVAALAWSLTRF